MLMRSLAFELLLKEDSIVLVIGVYLISLAFVSLCDYFFYTLLCVYELLLFWFEEHVYVQLYTLTFFCQNINCDHYFIKSCHKLLDDNNFETN